MAELEQPVQLTAPGFKLGPIANESTVKITVPQDPAILFDEGPRKHIIVFPIEISNTSEHPVDLREASYSFVWARRETSSEISSSKDTSGKDIPELDIILNPGQSYTLPIYAANDPDETQLKQFFGQTKSRLEFTMKTLDGNYTVGTDTKDYN